VYPPYDNQVARAGMWAPRSVSSAWIIRPYLLARVH